MKSKDREKNTLFSTYDEIRSVKSNQCWALTHFLVYSNVITFLIMSNVKPDLCLRQRCNEGPFVDLYSVGFDL